MKTIQKKWIVVWIMVVISVIQILFGIYANQVRNIYNDEIFSYGLANNTGDYVFFTDQEIEANANAAGWFPGRCLHNYLTVQPDERFDYANVFEKQRRDVHPPLFYLILHTICSFMPDTLNYMSAISINIAAMVGVSIFLCLTMQKIFGTRLSNVLPSILWVTSEACFALTNYVRMYALLNFFVMCMIYLNICIIVEQKTSIKRMVQLAICVCLGGLTHYYFYVFNFFFAACYVVMQWIRYRKEWKTKISIFSQYIGGYLIGGMAVLCIFPRTVYHLLKTNVGKQVTGNLKSGGLELKGNWNVVNNNAFHGRITIFLIGLLIVGVCLGIYYYKTKRKMQSLSTINQIVITLLITCVCYFFLIMRITIYVAWYYMSPLYGALTLLIVLLYLGYAQEKWTQVFAISVLVLVSGVILAKYIPNKINYVIQDRIGAEEYLAMVDEFAGDDCIYLSETWDCLYGNRALEMASLDEVRCISTLDIADTDLVSLLGGRDTPTGDIVLFMRQVDDPDTYVDIIEEQTGREVEQIWQDNRNIYFMIYE